MSKCCDTYTLSTKELIEEPSSKQLFCAPCSFVIPFTEILIYRLHEIEEINKFGRVRDLRLVGLH